MCEYRQKSSHDKRIGLFLKNFRQWLMISEKKPYLCHHKREENSWTVCRLRLRLLEESPGNTERFHFLTESCRQRQGNAEENNRPLLVSGPPFKQTDRVVRVRRRGKSPPGVWRQACRASWMLQVHVYRRSRAARPSRRVERGTPLRSRGAGVSLTVTSGEDK